MLFAFYTHSCHQKQKWTKQYNTNLKPDDIESLNIHCICFTILCEYFFFYYAKYRLRASQSDVPSLVARSTVIIHSCMPQKIKHFSLLLIFFCLQQGKQQTTSKQATLIVFYDILFCRWIFFFNFCATLANFMCVFSIYFWTFNLILKILFFFDFCSFKTIW